MYDLLRNAADVIYVHISTLNTAGDMPSLWRPNRSSLRRARSLSEYASWPQKVDGAGAGLRGLGAEELQQVVSQADQCPFTLHLLKTTH